MIQFKMDERKINKVKLAKFHGMTPTELDQESWFDYHLLLEEAIRESNPARASSSDW